MALPGDPGVGRENMFYKLMDGQPGEWFQLTEKEKTAVRRQIYEYINDSGKYRRVVENMVQDMIEVHDALKELHGFVDSELLGLAAHLCEKYRLDSSDLTGALIVRYFKCQQDLGDLFHVLKPLSVEQRQKLSRNPFYPFPLKSLGTNAKYDCKWLTKRHYAALDYYLFMWGGVLFNTKMRYLSLASGPQPNVLQLTVTNINLNNTPLLGVPLGGPHSGFETPLSTACHQGNPKAIILLLRHGALPVHNFRKYRDPEGNTEIPIWIIANHLKRNTKWVFSAEPGLGGDRGGTSGSQGGSRDVRADRGVQLIKCLRLLLRAQPFLPIEFSGRWPDGTDEDVINGINNNRIVIDEDAKDVFPTMALDERLVDLLPECLTEQVPTLQHQSRWVVRSRLRANRALPDGLDQIHISRVLLAFLDLQVD